MVRRGFSLLELIVVIMIAGIVVALALPRFTKARDAAAVHAAVGELGALYAAARQEAIARRAAVAVRIDTAGRAVELRVADARLVRRALGEIYGVGLGTNRDSTVYDPRGIGFGLSNVTIVVRRGSVVHTLTMSRLGRVRW
jgi:prepilin-type N-terminal cleavage/methylation domain-containing protein